MGLGLSLSPLLAALAALALLAWACTVPPFRLGVERMRGHGLLFLAPGIAGLVLHHLMVPAPGGGLLGGLLRILLLLGVALVQLGGLAWILARARPRPEPAGEGDGGASPWRTAAPLLPLLLASVLVKPAEALVVGTAEVLLGWTVVLAWVPGLLRAVLVLGEVVLGWFAVKWGINLFVRCVLDLRQGDAFYEVDAQHSADSVGRTLWPLVLILGLVAPHPGFVESGLALRADWPALLAPQASPWAAALPGGTGFLGAILWGLPFVGVQAVLLAGYVEGCEVHRRRMRE